MLLSCKKGFFLWRKRTHRLFREGKLISMCVLRRLVVLVLGCAMFVAAELELTLAVISNNRLASLRRLVESILALQNPNAVKINLVLNLEASSSVELEEYVYNIDWLHGAKFIHKRVVQGGLIGAVMESWFPTTDNNYGIFLEDDIEVSPYAIRWIERVLGLHQQGSSELP